MKTIKDYLPLLLLLISSILGFGFGFGCSSVQETYSDCGIRVGTQEEITEFIMTDNTRGNRYIIGLYDCFNFAIDLWRAAYLAGLNCSIVVVNMNESISGNKSLGDNLAGKYAHCMVQFPIMTKNGVDYMWIDGQGGGIAKAPGCFTPRFSGGIITTIHGADAFRLWQESVVLFRLSPARLHLDVCVCFYKVQTLLEMVAVE